jgi:hypothetical protein
MSGWTFDDLGKPESPERDHGLTLHHVSHAGHPFADDLGVAAIWINPGEKDGAHHGPFVLSSRDFLLIGGVSEEATAAPAPFEGYSIERGIRQAYSTRPIANDPVLGKDFPQLSVEQSYRFSAYGTDPPHEPTGQLPAGRIFPYVKFSTFNPKIRSIRIDYRMNLVFTRPTLVKEGESIYGISAPVSINTIPQTQAGVFRDEDSLPLGATIPGLPEIGKALTSRKFATEAFFTAAEKPVQYEILGHGLLDGVAGKLVRGSGFLRPLTWDNIHVWPKQEKLPSTPGAFHAGHMHWRWPRVVTDPMKAEEDAQKRLGVKAFGQKQFKGVTPGGGPLLDPNIPNQTIRFAIARRIRRQPETTEKFEDLFTKRKAEQIEAGDDLDIWLSFEVKRGTGLTPFFGGTTFVHGLFFAHEVESKNNPTAFTAGIALGQEKGPRPWLRDPQ